MSLKQWLKSNLVFILVLLAVALMICLNVWGKHFGKNPLAEQETLNNPVQVCLGGDGRYYYVTESSKQILVTDGAHTLLYKIDGGDAETGFETVSAVAVVRDGTLYVLDAVTGEDGMEIAGERILRYSPKGRFEEVIFSSVELDGEGSLSGLSAWEDTVCFTVVTDQSVILYELTEDGAKPLEVMDLEDATEYVMDSAVDGEGNVSVCLRNGDVLTWRDGSWNRVYKARDNDTEEYFSLVSEIDYGPSGELYLCDSGQREIRRLSPDGGLTTVLARGSFAQKGPETFAEMPLYSGLNADNGVVSVLTAEYLYQEEMDEEIFFYSLAGVSEQGEELFCADGVGISTAQRLCTVLVYLAAVLMAVLAVAAVGMVFQFLKQADIPSSTKFQLVMVVTALAVTLGVSYMIFENCNARFVDEASANLVNIAYRVAKGIDGEVLDALDSPDAYGTEAYERFDRNIREVLDSKINKTRDVYCVVYKVRNDVVCEAYQSDEGRGLMFPLAGKYAGGVEERIARENSYNITYESLAEGTYLYAILPYYAPDGSPAAFIELGTDYTSFNDETNDLYVQVLLLAVMAVIIIMLLFSEVICGSQAVQGIVKSHRDKRPCPPEVIRPLAFLYFMIANISTAFLPVYGMQLWDEGFPLQAELAAALPLTSEMITAAVVAFLCGFLVKRVGVRMVCVGGAALYIAGNLCSAFAGNLWVLIASNAVCGAGSGCLTLALNAWAAGYPDEERQNQGFIHINAAYLAGLNCGTVIGSMISDRFGIQNTYLGAAAAALVLTVLCAGMIGKVSTAEEEDRGGEGVSLRELFTPRVIRYFLCISVPYLTCTAFLEYFFPIEAEANGLSAAHISMAFLLSGLISIYAGSSLAEPITERVGSKKAMLLASFLYAAALIYLVVNPNIMSCYVVVVLFAAADSFGLSAQSVYFASLPAVKRVGQSMALGVNSTVESVVSACGSLVFGTALMLGTQRGIFLIAAAFTILTVLFVIGEGKETGAELSEVR